jgi:hypothetical protein
MLEYCSSIMKDFSVGRMRDEETERKFAGIAHRKCAGLPIQIGRFDLRLPALAVKRDYICNVDIRQR